MPPGVGRQLALGRLFRADQAGCHVGNAVDPFAVKNKVGRIFGVHENRVVLGRPAIFGAAAEIIGPDNLVDKTLATEDGVKQEDLAVVRLAIVDVEIERAV